MSEYIKKKKKEVAIELLKEIKARVPDDLEMCVQVSIDVVTSIPAADVEPVVRSRWKTHIHTLFVFGIDNETYTYECENCHCVEEKQSIRCPHCGAHMERSGSGE